MKTPGPGGSGLLKTHPHPGVKVVLHAAIWNSILGYSILVVVSICHATVFTCCIILGDPPPQNVSHKGIMEV